METNQVKDLGRKIKNIRLSERVSLRDLAERTGLTRSFLSQVERGKATPSIRSLEKITRALNTRLNHFFKEGFPAKFCLVREKGEKKFLTKGPKTVCEILAFDIPGIAMVPLVFTLGVGGRLSKGQLEKYNKERFMMVLKGKVELLCGAGDKRKFILQKGDSLYCKCDVPCKRVSNIGNRENIGNKEAIVLWVVRA